MQAFANLFGQNKNKLVITTAVPVDDQFSVPKQIRWSAALGKLLVSCQQNAQTGVRNYNLGFFSKFLTADYSNAVDSDTNNIFIASYVVLYKYTLGLSPISNSGIIVTGNSIRMIDASGDPDYVYVTSNNATDGHGVRKVRKSDMTVVASILATGAGDGQFNNPLGIKYHVDAGDGIAYLYVADYSNLRIVKLKASDLSFVANYVFAVNPRDLDTDGTNWYVSVSDLYIYKYDMSFTDATKATVSCVSYSLCIIPDQGDGYGATLAIVDNANSHLERRKCSDLSAINSVGSAGNGSSSLCDPVITGVAGVWIDSEGGRYSVASGANFGKNGFSGDFFRQSPNRMIYQPIGNLAAITAIDFNADAVQGEVKNLYKCVNLTSLKLQTNPALVLNLGRLSAKMQTLWAYACGSGISGSIRHMTALASVNLRENGASQAQVDQWIDDLWQNREIMAPGSANLNGTNAAPSGIYQDATPPTTGKEKAFDLVENYGWGLAITS